MRSKLELRFFYLKLKYEKNQFKIDDLNSKNHVNCQIHTYYNILKKNLCILNLNRKTSSKRMTWAKRKRFSSIFSSIFIYKVSNRFKEHYIFWKYIESFRYYYSNYFSLEVLLYYQLSRVNTYSLNESMNY